MDLVTVLSGYFC